MRVSARLALFTVLLVPPAVRAQPAERIYTNGVVWTGTGTFEAFAVRDGRIVAVGSARGMDHLRGPRTVEEDLLGAFVTPGLVDSHVHFFTGGFGLAGVDLRAARTPEEFVQRLAAFARTQSPGTWITGGDWDHEAWGGRLPERAWIDSVTANHPVFVNRLDGHMALANTLALRLAGVPDSVRAPEGGEIVRTADGRIAGVFKDEAMPLVGRAIPDPTPAQFDAAFERAQGHALSLGITQVHDVGSFGGWLDLEAIRRAHAADRLRLRFYSLVPVHTWRRLDQYVREHGRGDDRHKWGGLKGFVDGSLGSTTAWFYDPFTDAPETSGLVVVDTAAFARDLASADSAGLHLAVHAIGDRANDWILSVFARLKARGGPADRRFRVEHAQHLSDAAIARFGRDGVIPSMQPYHAIDDGRWAERRIGDRIRTTYAFRSLLDAGAPLAFGSDWTVAPLSAAEGLYAAVTRATLDGAHPGGWVPAQRIAVEAALRAYTHGGAYAGFWEGLTGTLAPGKAADFVVWDRNPLTIPAAELRHLRARRTFVGGEEVYRAD
jgi:predicted amidohydrolase YtcJ